MTNRIPRSEGAALSVNDTLPAAGPGPLPNAADNLDRLDALSNEHLNDMGVDTSEPPSAPLPALGNAVAEQTPARPVRTAQVSMPGVMLDAQPSQSERLDDIYRLAQSDRQSNESLDWLMRQTGGYPPPPAPGEAPGQPPAGEQQPAGPQPPPSEDAAQGGILDSLGDLNWMGDPLVDPATSRAILRDVISGLSDPKLWVGYPLKAGKSTAAFLDSVSDWLKETTGTDPRQFPGLGFRNVGRLRAQEDVTPLAGMVPQMGTPESYTGQILGPMLQFATEFYGLGKLGMKTPAPGIDRLGRQFVRATAAEYLGFEGNEKNLADLMLLGGDNLPEWARVASPAFRNAATEWLANKEGENELVARLKNSVAAGPLNAILPWIMNMGAVARNQRFLTHLTGSENFAEAKELLKQAGMPDETISTIVNYGLGSALRESKIDPNEFMVAMANFHAMRPPRRGGPLHPETPPPAGDPSAPRLPGPDDAAAPPTSGQPVPGAGSPPSQELTSLIDRINQGAQSLEGRVGGQGDLTTGDIVDQMQRGPGQAPQAGRAPGAAAQPPQPGEFLGSDNQPLIQQIERQLPPRADYGISDPQLARWMHDNLTRGEWRMPEPVESTPRPAPRPSDGPPANLDMIRLTNDEVDMVMSALMKRSEWYEAGVQADRQTWATAQPKSEMWRNLDRDALERAHAAVTAADTELRRRLGAKAVDAMIDDIMPMTRGFAQRASFDDIAKYVREKFGFEGEVGKPDISAAARGDGASPHRGLARTGKHGSLPEEAAFRKLMGQQYEIAKASGDLSGQYDILSGRLNNDRSMPAAMREAMELERVRLAHEMGPDGRKAAGIPDPKIEAAASGPRLPQSLARAVSGADETLSKHWDKMPEGLRKEIVADAQVMPGYAVGERITSRVMTSAVESGHNAQIEKRVVEAVMDEWRPLAPLMPSDYKFGILERVEPIAKTRKVKATFRLANGKTASADMKWDDLNGSRAFHAVGGDLGNFIGIVRRYAPVAGGDFVEQFSHSLRGEMAHELGHALLRSVDQAVRERLFAHAKGLHILDMPTIDYFKNISREDAIDDVRTASRTHTLRTLYQHFYHKSPRKDALVREESVTVMLELIQHGRINVAARAGLQADLDVLFGQNFPVRAPGKPDISAAVSEPGLSPHPAERRGGAEPVKSAATEMSELQKIPTYEEAIQGAIRAFHGSPYDFDAFDISKIGTGEGAQAFGYGLYFAEREGVATAYRETLSAGGGMTPFDYEQILNQRVVQNVEYAKLSDNDKGILSDNITSYAIFSAQNRAGVPIKEWVDSFVPRLRKKYVRVDDPESIGRIMLDAQPSGRLYEVSLDVDPEQLLDWDKALSEQSAAVKALANRKEFGFPPPSVTGQALLARLADPASGASPGKDAVSRLLREAGIPGIRYLDQGSRGKGDGTYNYVIFDDSLVKIVAKDGKPVSKEEAADVIKGMHAEQTDEIQGAIGGAKQSLMDRIRSLGKDSWGELSVEEKIELGKPDTTGTAPDSAQLHTARLVDALDAYGAEQVDLRAFSPRSLPAADGAMKGYIILDDGRLYDLSPRSTALNAEDTAGFKGHDAFYETLTVRSEIDKKGVLTRLPEITLFMDRDGGAEFGARSTSGMTAPQLSSLRTFARRLGIKGSDLYAMHEEDGLHIVVGARPAFRRLSEFGNSIPARRGGDSPVKSGTAEMSAFPEGEIQAAAGGNMPPVPPRGGPPAPPSAPDPNGNFSREFQVNWTHIESQDQLKSVAGQMMDAFRDEMVARGVSGGGKGHVQTWEQTAQQAGMLDAIEHLFKIGEQKGLTHNAVGMEALGTLYTSSMKELERLVRLAASPQATPETYVQMRHQMTMHRMVQNEFWGGVSEAGRTLNILRKVKSSSQGYQQSLQQIIESTGGVDSNRALAEALAGYLDEGDFRRLDQVLEKGITARTIDAVIEMRTGGLLTGPPTWERNIIGNTLATPLSILERKVAEYIGAILHPVDGVKFGEAAAMAQGQMRSLREGLSALAESWTTGAFRIGQSSVEQYATRPSALGAEAMNLSTPDAWRNRQEPAWADRGDPNAPKGNIGPHDARRFKALIPGSGLYGQLAAKPTDTFGLAVDILSQVYGHMSFRPTGAPDAFFKVIHKNAELYAQAWRKANDEILRGEISDADFETRLTELRQNPTEDMTEAANRAANYNTWTDENTARFSKYVNLLRNDPNPAWRLGANILIPFWRTPSRILNYTFERTPLAFLSSKVNKAIGDGGPEADLAYARMALGTMMLGLGGSLLVEGWISNDKGTITGGMPTKRPLREAAQRLGAKDYSVRVPTGETDGDGDPVYAFIPIQNIGGAADIFLWGAMLADARNRMDHLRNRDPENVDQFEIDWDKAMAAAVFASADLMMAKSSLQGVSEFMRAIGTRETSRQVNWSERLTQSFVPASSGLRYARRHGVPGVVEGDPVRREVTGYIDALYDLIPGLSTQLPPVLDTWGRPITYQSGLGGAFDAFMPFATRTSANAQAIDKELLRLGWGPETPQRISILRSEAAQQALERGGGRSSPRRDRGLGILDSVLADPSDFRTGESNVVTLSGMPKVMNRLIELRGQTTAAQLVRDNEDHLISANRAAVARSLDEYGDKTLLQTLNALVKDPRYLSRDLTDDQRQQTIKDIIRDFETAAKAQVIREFPELQKRRDAMPRPRRGEAAPPARGQALPVQ